MARCARAHAHLEAQRALDLKLNGVQEGRRSISAIFARGEHNCSFNSLLAAFDIEETGFISVQDLGRALGLGPSSLKETLENEEVHDWLTSDKLRINYQGLTVATNCNAALKELKQLHEAIATCPVLSDAEEQTILTWLEKFGDRDEAGLSEKQVAMAFGFALGTTKGTDHAGTRELVAQCRDAIHELLLQSDPNAKVPTLFNLPQLVEIIHTRASSPSMLGGYTARTLRHALLQSVRDGVTPERIFELVDRDGDGVLSVKDLISSLKIFGFPSQSCTSGAANYVATILGELQGGGCSTGQFCTFLSVECVDNDDDGDIRDSSEMKNQVPDDLLDHQAAALLDARSQVRHLAATNESLSVQCSAEIEVRKSMSRRVGILADENARLRARLEQTSNRVQNSSTDGMLSLTDKAHNQAEDTDTLGTDVSTSGDEIQERQRLASKLKSGAIRSIAFNQANLYRQFPRDALAQRICELKKELRIIKTRSSQQDALLEGLTWENMDAEHRLSEYAQTLSRMESALEALDAENDALRSIPRSSDNRKGSSQSDDTPAHSFQGQESMAAKGSFWLTLVNLNQDAAACLLRQACLSGDTFLAKSILSTAKKHLSIAHAMTLLECPEMSSGDTALHCACRQGDASVVRELYAVAKGLGALAHIIQIQNFNGQTPLAVAFSCGNTSAARVLRPSPVDQDWIRGSPQYEHIEPADAIASLADNPQQQQTVFDQKEQDSDCRPYLTPYMFACASLASAEECEAVLSQIPLPHILEEVSHSGCTALFFAMFCNPSPEHAVVQLCRQGANVAQFDKRGWTVLHYAAVWSGFDDLVTERLFPNCKTLACLTAAQFASILCCAAANARGTSPLMYAILRLIAQRDHDFINQVLAFKVSQSSVILDKGSESSSECMDALTTASAAGDADLVRSLLALCTLTNIKSRNSGNTAFTPAMAAAQGGHLQVFRELLQVLGPEILSDRDSHGETALFKAASAGHLAVCETILAVGSREPLGLITVAERKALAQSHEREKHANADLITDLLDAKQRSIQASALGKKIEQGWVQHMSNGELCSCLLDDQHKDWVLFETQAFVGKEQLKDLINDLPQCATSDDDSAGGQQVCYEPTIPARIIRILIDGNNHFESPLSCAQAISLHVVAELSFPDKSQSIVTLAAHQLNNGKGLEAKQVAELKIGEKGVKLEVAIESLPGHGTTCVIPEHTSLLQRRLPLLEAGARITAGVPLPGKNGTKLSKVKARVLSAHLQNGYRPVYQIVFKDRAGGDQEATIFHEDVLKIQKSKQSMKRAQKSRRKRRPSF